MWEIVVVELSPSFFYFCFQHIAAAAAVTAFAHFLVAIGRGDLLCKTRFVRGFHPYVDS